MWQSGPNIPLKPEVLVGGNSSYAWAYEASQGDGEFESKSQKYQGRDFYFYDHTVSAAVEKIFQANLLAKAQGKNIKDVQETIPPNGKYIMVSKGNNNFAGLQDTEYIQKNSKTSFIRKMFRITDFVQV